MPLTSFQRELLETSRWYELTDEEKFGLLRDVIVDGLIDAQLKEDQERAKRYQDDRADPGFYRYPPWSGVYTRNPE